MPDDAISRRDWIRHCAQTGSGAALASSASAAAAVQTAVSGGYNNYFGDLHNHNQVGYAQGTLERSFEVARNHLDFYAFTPHSYWPDVGQYDGKIEYKWRNGFAVAKARWPDVVRLAREFDDPGNFTTILGYERHGTMEGGYHILFPDLDGDYELIEELDELQAFAKKRGCILVPHHPSNRLGHRGIASSSIDPAVSPVLEIHSEWGCAEHDRAPHPYKRHTEGGRWTRHTLQHYLADGHRLGVIASTDDHLGYPGAYREGLAVVKAHELSREAIFDALRNRRTYAVTGDRIELDFSVNGAMMGRETPYAEKRTIHARVRGWDEIDRVEIVKNGRVIHRDFPVDRDPGASRWDGPAVVRFEYGWGTRPTGTSRSRWTGGGSRSAIRALPPDGWKQSAGDPSTNEAPVTRSTPFRAGITIRNKGSLRAGSSTASLGFEFRPFCALGFPTSNVPGPHSPMSRPSISASFAATREPSSSSPHSPSVTPGSSMPPTRPAMSSLVVPYSYPEAWRGIVVP